MKRSGKRKVTPRKDTVRRGDWKKMKYHTGENYWESDNKDDSVLVIKASKLTHAKSGYLVLKQKSNVPKYFKIKSKAMTHAKNYMRKNA